MPQDKTSLFNVKDIDNRFISDILEEVWGSLVSGDPGYISSYQDARNKIQQIDRAKIIEVLLQEFYKNHQ